MNESDLNKGVTVRNLKHGNMETIICPNALMKTDCGDWVPCVVYEGFDRNNPKEEKVFVKRKEDFLNEFEIIKSNPESFREYMDRVYEQLEENVTDEWKEKYPYNVFSFTKKEVDSNIRHFVDCFLSNISPYKSLVFFKL